MSAEKKSVDDAIKPKHITIIPDGNRRWAKLHNITVQEGYRVGINHIKDVLAWCKEADIRILSMWGFSIENFQRDSNEILNLFKLFKSNLINILRSDEKNKHDVRVRFFGRIHLFSKEIQKLIRKAEEISAKNETYQLNLFLAYGGRQEIVDTINDIFSKGIRYVDEKTISEHLYTRNIPDPDLIIRTSGEMRLSGLMPWQSCYSEFYFCKKLWPDFSKKDFLAALKEYTRRKRRFGH